MPTAVLTDRERAAVQAYLRLLHTVRAALDTAGHTAAARTAQAAPGPARIPVVPPSLLADADTALDAVRLAGNEDEFFALLRAWCPGMGAPGS